jgi:hypothetical protein
VIWRPWIIASLLILAVLVNGMLLVNERIPSQLAEVEVEAADERLKNLQYNAGNRRANLQVMGLSVELAEDTANHYSRFARQAERFEQLLEEQATELTPVLCPAQLPQPYAALSVLVYEENGVRYVVDPMTVKQLERQPWYDASLVPALYDQYERTANRRAEATIMAVSAALLGMEEDALEGQSPWSRGVLGSWGFSRLESQQPRVRRLVIEYFSLMHFLTELANDPQDGICS